MVAYKDQTSCEWRSAIRWLWTRTVGAGIRSDRMSAGQDDARAAAPGAGAGTGTVAGFFGAGPRTALTLRSFRARFLAFLSDFPDFAAGSRSPDDVETVTM